MKKSIYLLCPVRRCTHKQKAALEEYVKALEDAGHCVHYPLRDVPQDDDGCGLQICLTHRLAMEQCDEVHVWWDATSTGSHFDFGMAFAMRKPVKLAREHAKTPHKSYGNVLLQLGTNGENQ